MGYIVIKCINKRLKVLNDLMKRQKHKKDEFSYKIILVKYNIIFK